MNVLMLHFGRCGSTVVGNMLRQHPDIQWDSEILQYRKRNLLPECVLTQDPKTLLRLRSMRAGKKNFGLEIKPLPFMHLSCEQLNMTIEEFFDYQKELNITHVIFLTRGHYLRQLISLTIAVERSLYELQAESRPDIAKVNVNCVATSFGGIPILELFREYDRISNSIRHFSESMYGERFLELEYSNHILSSPQIAFEKILCHLDLEPIEVEKRNSRVNSLPMQELVCDWQNVCEVLKGTPYQWMCFQDEFHVPPR